MSTSNKIQLKNVSYTYDQTPILQNLNLELAADTRYTLIGPSGAGKTTLLNLLAGLLEKTSGSITQADQPYLANKVGLVPQDYGLLPWQTVEKSVAAAVLIRQQQKHLTRKQQLKLQHLFEALGLTALKSCYPHQLSGGQKQRVALARAFALPNDLLLLDEPFAALDALTREKLQHLFLTMWQKQPTTSLFITHDMTEAVLLGQQILVLTRTGQLKTILSNPFVESSQPDPARLAFIQQLKGALRDGP